jgi:hypothetical protein
MIVGIVYVHHSVGSDITGVYTFELPMCYRRSRKNGRQITFSSKIEVRTSAYALKYNSDELTKQ